MTNNQISPFEYISILVSIIIGLGITQILSAFTDLLYNFKKVKFYWPHSFWIVFILFLQIQDWFVFYKLETIKVWTLPLLIFVISYPVTLFICSKMLLPTNDLEEKTDMKKFYFSQFQIIFIFVSLSIVLSVLFNIFILNRPFYEQTILLLFLTATLYLSIKNNNKEILHKLLAIFILLVSITVLVFENNFWVVK
jgi:hypothetical protein